MLSITLPAPAKLNRFLHLVGQRADGYHELQTIFQFVDLCDELHFTLRKDSKITLNCNDHSISIDSNLVLQAANLLQRSNKHGSGIDIVLNKRIPHSAGLGGGSSDAATTLLALNKLWKLNLNTEQLCKLGLQVGADVPIFIQGKSAWAEGIGEKITPLELPPAWFVILVPNVKVPTVEIFYDKKLTRDTTRCTISPSLIDTGHNDCETVVRKRYPEVGKAIDWLDQFATTRMSGTGGAVFAPFTELSDAMDVIQQVPDDIKGFVVRGLNTSPVIRLLA